MNCMFIAICTIAVFFAGSSSATPSPFMGLDELTSALPGMNGGNPTSALTNVVPISGGSNGGLLKVRSFAVDSEDSSLEPRGIAPGLDSLGYLPKGLPGLGGTSSMLPTDGLDGLTSMMPMGGSKGGFLKVRRSTVVAPSHVKRLSLLGLDKHISANETKAHTGAPSASPKSSGELLPLKELPTTLLGLKL